MKVVIAAVFTAGLFAAGAAAADNKYQIVEPGMNTYKFEVGQTIGNPYQNAPIGPNSYNANSCEDQSNKVVEGLGVSMDRIESMRTVVDFVDPANDAMSDFTKGKSNWYKLKGEAGSLVVKMTAHCTVLETWTQGDMKLDGVEQY